MVKVESDQRVKVDFLNAEHNKPDAARIELSIGNYDPKAVEAELEKVKRLLEVEVERLENGYYDEE